MKILKYFYIFSVCYLLIGCASFYAPNRTTKTISPFDYGLKKAKTGIDTYWVLYNTHKEAAISGKRVSYEGIKRLEIEIPIDAKSIPLVSINDFGGLELIVNNKSKDFVLFTKENTARKIIIKKEDIDIGDFSKCEELRQGKYILQITDEEPWIINRKGYNYGHARSDVLLIEKGKAVNHTVFSYNNRESKPSCCVYDASESLTFKGIIFKRSEEATKKTYLFFIKGVNDVNIKDVTSYTPISDMTADCLMRIDNCTNVVFDDVNIDGTYSQTNHSGYGISLNNVWNLKAKKIIANANWGVFGNNNINTAEIKDCIINRFDVHCYGRDLYFKNVKFDKLYNQFSSMFGKIVFDNCCFQNFIPVLYESAYNAFTQHELCFLGCEFSISPSQNYLIMTGSIFSARNCREQLMNQCLPNVVIQNMIVNVPQGLKDFYVFKIGVNTENDLQLDYIDKIIIDGLKFVCDRDVDKVNLVISNKDVCTKNKLHIQLKNIKTKQNNRENNDNEIDGSIIIGLNKEKHKNRIEINKTNNFTINE